MREAMREAEVSGEVGDLPAGVALVINGEVVSRPVPPAKLMRTSFDMRN